MFSPMSTTAHCAYVAARQFSRYSPPDAAGSTRNYCNLSRDFHMAPDGMWQCSCVGVLLDEGLIFASDSRTHAGVDNFATFSKMTVFERPGDRLIVMMSSGGLAGTQAVISILKQRGDDRRPCPACGVRDTMFDAATAGVGCDAGRRPPRQSVPDGQSSGASTLRSSWAGRFAGEPAAPLSHLRRGQFHRGGARNALSSDRRNQVRQTDHSIAW